MREKSGCEEKKEETDESVCEKNMKDVHCAYSRTDWIRFNEGY